MTVDRGYIRRQVVCHSLTMLSKYCPLLTTKTYPQFTLVKEFPHGCKRKPAYITYPEQGRNYRKMLAATSSMGGQNLPSWLG